MTCKGCNLIGCQLKDNPPKACMITGPELTGPWGTKAYRVTQGEEYRMRADAIGFKGDFE